LSRHWLRAFPAPKQNPRPPQRHAPRTQTVETVEKVPFQKLILEKWDRNTEKYLVFCIPHNILAIFEPVVGDFCEDFLQKEFFDSLVGRFAEKQNREQRQIRFCKSASFGRLLFFHFLLWKSVFEER
jgi:hypothetical protein